MQHKFDFVIYHKNCLDGFTGLFVLWLAGTFDKNAIIYPDVPSAQDMPLGLHGKKVGIVDVAYKKDVLRKIVDSAKSVLFIDHHISIKEEIEEIQKYIKQNNKKATVYFDEKGCGASLAWDYFFKDKKPQLINLIKDNDMGIWELPKTKEFITGLEVNYLLEPSYKNLKKWKNLLKEKEIKKVIRFGSVYMEYKKYLLNQNAKRYSLEQFPSQFMFDKFPGFFNKVGQYKVAVYNGSGCPSTSSLGELMMKKIDCDFVFIWSYNLDKKDYVVSLRSVDDGVDVGSIAQLYGGGGHHSSAAFFFSDTKYTIRDFFMPESLPRQPRQQNKIK